MWQEVVVVVIERSLIWMDVVMKVVKVAVEVWATEGSNVPVKAKVLAQEVKRHRGHRGVMMVYRGVMMG